MTPLVFLTVSHGSTVGIAEHLPAYGGLLLEEEVERMEMAIKNPARPFVAIMGGKKVSTKIAVIDRLLEKVHTLLIGGGVANTFLKTWGIDIGTSFYEPDMLDVAHRLIWKAMRSNTSLVLPTDVVVAKEISQKAQAKTVSIENIPKDHLIVDIGPNTIKQFKTEIREARTLLWSGPMGVFEILAFRKGNDAVRDIITKSTAYSIVGGGDTIASIGHGQSIKHISHISTGGGATLEFIEKGTLPGIEVLLDR